MAGMTTTENVTLRHHPPIEWIDIHGDGSETPRRGTVWSPAAVVSGVGKAWWVLPEPVAASEPSSEPVLLLVAHLAAPEAQGTLPGLEEGRRPPVPRIYRPGRVIRGRWFAKQGRLVFAGETIRETHARSAFARREALQRTLRPPARVRLKPADPGAQAELDAFVRALSTP